MRKDIFHHPRYIQKKVLHKPDENAEEHPPQEVKKILKKNPIVPRKEHSPKPMNPKVLREAKQRERKKKKGSLI